MRVWNVPATIHAETSDWLIEARTSQRPFAAGAPIERYAMPRGAKSLKNRGALAACDEVVSRLTSPENGVAVKTLAATLAALSKARPKMEAGSSGIGWVAAASAIEDAAEPSSLSTLRFTWRSRHAVSLWLSPSS